MPIQTITCHINLNSVTVKAIYNKFATSYNNNGLTGMMTDQIRNFGDLWLLETETGCSDVCVGAYMDTSVWVQHDTNSAPKTKISPQKGRVVLVEERYLKIPISMTSFFPI